MEITCNLVDPKALISEDAPVAANRNVVLSTKNSNNPQGTSTLTHAVVDKSGRLIIKKEDNEDMTQNEQSDNKIPDKEDDSTNVDKEGDTMTPCDGDNMTSAESTSAVLAEVKDELMDTM